MKKDKEVWKLISSDKYRQKGVNFFFKMEKEKKVWARFQVRAGLSLGGSNLLLQIKLPAFDAFFTGFDPNWFALNSQTGIAANPD